MEPAEGCESDIDNCKNGSSERSQSVKIEEEEKAQGNAGSVVDVQDRINN